VSCGNVFGVERVDRMRVVPGGYIFEYAGSDVEFYVREVCGGFVLDVEWVDVVYELCGGYGVDCGWCFE